MTNHQPHSKHFHYECTLGLIHTVQDHTPDLGKLHFILQKQNAQFSLEVHLAGPLANCGVRFF